MLFSGYNCSVIDELGFFFKYKWFNKWITHLSPGMLRTVNVGILT